MRPLALKLLGLGREHRPALPPPRALALLPAAVGDGERSPCSAPRPLPWVSAYAQRASLRHGAVRAPSARRQLRVPGSQPAAGRPEGERALEELEMCCLQEILSRSGR